MGNDQRDSHRNSDIQDWQRHDRLGSRDQRKRNLERRISPTTTNGFIGGRHHRRKLPTGGRLGVHRIEWNTDPDSECPGLHHVTLASTALSLSKVGSQSLTVTTASSPLITVSPSSSTATLSVNGSSTVSLAIAASSSAANHAPRLPWTGGPLAFGAVLAGVPLARRRKRTMAVLLTALAISNAWLPNVRRRRR